MFFGNTWCDILERAVSPWPEQGLFNLAETVCQHVSNIYLEIFTDLIFCYFLRVPLKQQIYS